MSNHEVSEVSVPNAKVIVSFILGVLSIVLISSMGFILGVVGLIFGIIGLSELKRLNQGGKNIVISGIICNSISIFLPIVLSIIYVVAG